MTPQAPATRSASLRYPGIPAMLLVWSAVGTLTYARYYFQFGAPPFDGAIVPGLLACIACYYPWAVLTPLVFRIEHRYPLGIPQWPRNIVYLVLVSVPLSLLASPLMLGLDGAVRYAVQGSIRFPHGWMAWLREFPVAEALFWSSVAGGYFIRTIFQLHERERSAARLALEKSELEASLRQAQLEALRSRLNPHFLFNSLQNISVLAQQDPRTASRMLTRLGDLLRAVLRGDSLPETTLGEEIELSRKYVSVEQMRFGDRLSVAFAVAGDVEGAMVPRFLLQPLIENAIVHGLRGVQRTGTIVVRASRDGGELVLTVTDNGIGLPCDDPSDLKIGVGLGSTCERLAKMYPEHAFSIRRVPEGGTEVRIALPLKIHSVVAKMNDEQTPVADS